MLAAFLHKSIAFFVAEAFIEGIGNCFSSGTKSAYLYSVYGDEAYVKKTAHASNFGTAGFVVSTLAYALIYRGFGMEGLLVATIFSGFFAVVLSFFLVREKTVKTARTLTVKRVLGLFLNKKAIMYLMILSVFSLSWILINFFFVEKLQCVGISVEWMSLIIIAYSVIQMLAEPLLGLTQRYSQKVFFRITGCVVGVAMVLFGLASLRIIVVVLMCTIPLLLTLPEYIFMDYENQFVDEMGLEEDRAAALSVLNMGVNLVEIMVLFTSACFSLGAITWCFAFVGIALVIGVFFVNGFKATYPKLEETQIPDVKKPDIPKSGKVR